MSHQTGIKANEQLIKCFASQCKPGKIRAVKISIENEQLTLSSLQKLENNWDVDFDKIMNHFIQPEQPCFILYRFDTKNENGGYNWLLISWSPDDSPIREKMLYASTKATLKQEFGSASITEELHATTLNEVSLKGLQCCRAAHKSPAPLTNQEEEMAELRKVHNMSLSNAAVDSRTQTISGVSFPVSNAVVQSVELLKTNKINYIQMKIDIENEEILLVKESKIGSEGLSAEIPKDVARYHLFSFVHEYEGEKMKSVVFVYSMPGYACSVKERMLYSSCKAPFIDLLESNLGLSIARKLEIDCDEKLSDEFLIDEIHPKKATDKPKFEKPKGPPSRGAKRLTKTAPH